MFDKVGNPSFAIVLIPRTNAHHQTYGYRSSVRHRTCYDSQPVAQSSLFEAVDIVVGLYKHDTILGYIVRCGQLPWCLKFVGNRSYYR